MSAKAGSRLTPEQVALRKTAIVAARRAFEPFDAIGATHGITSQRAHQIYWEAMRETPNSQVEEHRQEQTDLADKAVNALLAIAEDPDVSARTRVEAWSSIKGWCEHKAKLLALYAPLRREITVLSESTVDLALAKAAADHAAKVAELEALENRAISEADRLLADVDA
jgi:hypothetical protein